jgi:hypothetical protein
MHESLPFTTVQFFSISRLLCNGGISNVNMLVFSGEKRRRWSATGCDPTTFQMRLRHVVFVCYCTGNQITYWWPADPLGCLEHTLYIWSRVRDAIFHTRRFVEISLSRTEPTTATSAADCYICFVCHIGREKMGTGDRVESRSKLWGATNRDQGSLSRLRFKVGTFEYEVACSSIH